MALRLIQGLILCLCLGLSACTGDLDVPKTDKGPPAGDLSQVMHEDPKLTLPE